MLKETGGLLLDDFDELSHGTSNEYTNLALNGDSSRLYVLDPYSDDGRQVQIFDTSNDSFVKTIYTQQPAESIAIAPDTAGHLVVGDDHSTGEVYFGTDQSQSLTDGVAFSGGSFGTYNSDFLLPAGTHTMSDSVTIHVDGATSSDGQTTDTISSDSDRSGVTPVATPGEPNDFSGTPSMAIPIDEPSSGTIDIQNVALYTGSAIGLFLILFFVFFRRRHKHEP